MQTRLAIEELWPLTDEEAAQRIGAFLRELQIERRTGGISQLQPDEMLSLVQSTLWSQSLGEPTPEEEQATELMALEIEKLKAQGYVLKDSTPKDVASAWHWHCRQQSLPYIQISIRPIQSSKLSGPFAILLSTEETMRPAKRTSSRMAKLRKDWTERIGRSIDSYTLNAREGSLRGLTEEQAISLASDLWTILSQPGAYEQVELEDDLREE